MTLQRHGKSTLEVEICNIDAHGFWVFVKGKEYVLSYEDYPWFKDAKIGDIIDVELLHESHLHWPTLDVDLDVASLEDPSQTPLVYQY